MGALNRGVGYLLGRPDLETESNPLGPATIVGAFTRRVNSLKTDRKTKFQIMKDLNQAQLGDITAIYADLNKHLKRLNMLPGAGPRRVINRAAAARGAETSAGRAEASDRRQQGRRKST